jgi:hypothetical protein
VFYLKRLLLLLIWILFVSNFLFAWAVWHIMAGGQRIEKSKADIIIKIAKVPSVFFHELIVYTGLGPSQLAIPNQIDQYRTKNMSGYLLISTLSSENQLAEIQLLDLEKKKVVQRWQPNFDDLELKNISKFNLRMTHPLLLKKDLITIADGILYRFDKNSMIKWKNDGNFHHSIELDAENSIWVCGTINRAVNGHSIHSTIWDDGIFKLNPDNGKTIFKKSIYDILIENNYQYILFNTGPNTQDLIHVNDIQPAFKTTKYWQKGDLLISMRNRSSVFLYRPSTNKIIWFKTGPWNFQHDCDFLNDTEIGVFGNDVTDFNGKSYLIHGHNNQYVYNFKSGKVSTPYTQMFKNGKIKTLTEGRSRILPDGQLFVEETNFGRILFGDFKGVNGTYVNRINDDYIGMLGWSRYYTKEEYKLSTQ